MKKELDKERNAFILAKPEHFKGMTYVRLSSLPDEQKMRIREDHPRDTIIKILKDNSLMNDCIMYDDYVTWHNQCNPSRIISFEMERTNS